MGEFLISHLSVLEVVDDGGDHAHFFDVGSGGGGVVDGELAL